MSLRAMTPYLRAQRSFQQPGLAGLPLGECARELGLDGLALLLAPGKGQAELVRCHGRRAELLEDVQLVHGQGPSRDAAHDGTLVLEPDLADLAPSRWPGLAGALLTAGIAAVFAFPLRVGGTVLGSLTGHRATPGPLTSVQLGDALALAGAAARAATADAALPDGPAGLVLNEPELHFAEVHQATGMLSAQLHVPCAQALALLRGHAFAHACPLLAVARDVLGHRLSLRAPGDGAP